MLKRYNYLLYHKNHYHYIRNIVPKKDNTMGKHKRGLLAFDFETRKTEEWVFVGATKSYYIKDTICKAVYQRYKKEYSEVATFVTNTQKSSARQFLDWLINERVAGRFYTCIAHNGSRFDFYILRSVMTEDELLQDAPRKKCSIQSRVSAIFFALGDAVAARTARL